MKKRNFNIAVALELYYSQNEFSNKDIMQIFGCSLSRAYTLKKKVWEHMAANGDHPVVFDYTCINAEYAFKVWGLDVSDLERKYKKLIKIREMRGEPAPATA